MQTPLNKVIAVTPLSHINDFKQTFFHSSNVFAIELLDSADNIFDRLVFSDENDMIYEDEDYKSKHKSHYLKEIKEDQAWYGSIYSDIAHKFNMNGRQPEDVVNALISEFKLGGI